MGGGVRAARQLYPQLRNVTRVIGIPSGLNPRHHRWPTALALTQTLPVSSAAITSPSKRHRRRRSGVGLNHTQALDNFRLSRLILLFQLGKTAAALEASPERRLTCARVSRPGR